MRFDPRRIGIILVLLFALITGTLHAQDEVRVVGSGIVEPLMQAIVDASPVEANFDIEITGTSTGFERFCSGEADATTSTRPLTQAERSACAENEIVPFELVIGQTVLALVANPEDTSFATCLTEDEINTIFAPSAEGEITNWNQVLEEGPDLALTVLAPGSITSEFAILDTVIEGDGLRSDVTTAASADEIISMVSETPGAVGVVTLPQALAAGDAVQIVELDAAAVQGCQAPSAAAVEDGLYAAAEQLYLYVNAASLDNADLVTVLEFVTSEALTPVVESAGFTASTDVARQTNQENLEAALAGDISVQTNADFEIPLGLTGAVNIGGAGEGVNLLQGITTDFSEIAPGVTINLNLEGLPASARRLCNGETDFIYSYRDLTDEEASNCAANNIELTTFDVGTQAVVLLANGGSDELACLTTDALATVWRAGSGEAVTNWNQVDDSFSDQPMTLFAPTEGSFNTDLLLLAASGESLIGRVDIQLDDDPLYRAAATANVEGALTYMGWAEYQRVLANNQANIQLVAVDGGSGCVTPVLNTIMSGEYPITRVGKLLVNTSQLARIEVQSVLWHLFSDENLPLYENAGYIGIRASDLEDWRVALLEAVNQAQAANVQGEATAEPDAADEATPEMTAEADATEVVEPTEEATEAMTPEVEETLEVTEEVPAETEPEPTEEATAEAE